ncbi:cell division protein FtsZ [Rubricoccus marinus]|uniref:Cell division protein FtsZ n=1 Tax=Rubricoccus marinus TaxID=716817 RepID=A0A259U2S7_9BACT|nr:cell division protein FtsZ [Rubricoccus marinus]OZC04094.1 cell division protein FtsZ [Rubricoccus marinus]
MEDFSTRFAFDDDAPTDANIRVIGCGGGGGNAVNNMLAKGIHGVEFTAVNTDAQALQVNLAPLKIQIGRERTSGLGAGARPSVGAEAAQESHKEIEAALQGCDMVFVTAGMGGGTGTGAAPVIAAIAKEMGILTVAVVTKPFVCEGKKRLRMAEQGIQNLRDTVDTLVIVPNERLLDIAEDDTTLVDAFVMADDVLYNAVRGISELITVHGLINLDFADVRTTMLDGGTALMGSAIASGDKRAERAAREALESPLLDGISIDGARNVLVNITAGPSLSIREATHGMSVIQQQAGDEAEVIFGTVIDPEMGDHLRVTVMATGFDANQGAPEEAPEVIQRSIPLNLDHHVSPHYKGETNLRDLDKPAYERRSRVAPPSEKSREVEESPSAVPLKNVKRLRISELPAEPGERIKKGGDPDVPAFLRRMMD